MPEESNRERQPIRVTLPPDVYHYLKQPNINASGAVELAVRQNVREQAIREAALEAGMTEEEIEEARQR